MKYDYYAKLEFDNLDLIAESKLYKAQIDTLNQQLERAKDIIDLQEETIKELKVKLYDLSALEVEIEANVNEIVNY